MDSLHGLLDPTRFAEPPEIAGIKSFISDKYQVQVAVISQPSQIVIVTSSAALAGTLRLEMAALQAAANTKKRIIIRIGQ